MLVVGPYLDVVEKCETGLGRVLGLNEQQFAPLQLVDDALVVPAGHHTLQVQVGGEEADDAVRHDSADLYEQLAVVPHHTHVFSRLKPRRDSHLVIALGYYL